MAKKVMPGLMAGLVMVLAASMLLSGCSVLRSKKNSASQGTAASGASSQNAPVYYDFGDVMLPSELKVDKDESFVFRTPGLTAGVLTLSGRVEINSLIAFFENKMPADGWRMISEFKGQHTMLLFNKQNRWCVIGITENHLNTNTRIWVSPTLQGAEMGLTK